MPQARRAFTRSPSSIHTWVHFNKIYKNALNQTISTLCCIHCNPLQGQYRARTGISLCSISTQREKPVFSSWDPCNENRIFPVGNTTQGKPCFHYRDGFAVLYYIYVKQWLRLKCTWFQKTLPNNLSSHSSIFFFFFWTTHHTFHTILL